MEKTFRRMIDKPSARHAYVEAEVTTALARQIRHIRMQRGWSQSELARRLGTTQAAISRAEDPSYGRISIKTLFELSKAFDCGLEVRFLSLVKMLEDTWKPSPQRQDVPAFEEEALHVGFHASGPKYENTFVARVAFESTPTLLTRSVLFPVKDAVAGARKPTDWTVLMAHNLSTTFATPKEPASLAPVTQNFLERHDG